MSDVEDTIKRISNHKDVQGVILVNQDGIPFRTTLDYSLATRLVRGNLFRRVIIS